ncbi:hypothetical protein Selin_2277 [Desulfurispirillum indicum S5]|uniref:Leucine-binding protein domain-containing protein n=1 Tax=Desulfurispirillum indicum (strain ATCC BAA-1389 / DSM 22839 / S5) TaxID=653733 RepID=E6W433_DESIS|nr:hypothetical protein [Desulfurispirillum indicum]ADU66997.1 hypothetical protein Selin_2277 [Desulfurispirillum indicum S5]
MPALRLITLLTIAALLMLSGCAGPAKSTFEGISTTFGDTDDQTIQGQRHPRHRAAVDDRYLWDSLQGYAMPFSLQQDMEMDPGRAIEAYHDSFRSLAVVLDFSPAYFSASREILRGITASAHERGFSLIVYNSASMEEEELLDSLRPYAVVIGPLQPSLLEKMRARFGQRKVFITPTIAHNPQQPAEYSTGLSVRDEVSAVIKQMEDDGIFRYIVFRPGEPMTAEYANAIKQQAQYSRYLTLFRERIYSKQLNNQSRVIREFLGELVEHQTREKFATYTTDFDGVFLPMDFLDAIVVAPLFPFFNFDMDHLKVYGTSYWHDQKIYEAAPHIHGARFPTLYISDNRWISDVIFRRSLQEYSHSDQPSWLSAQGYDAATLGHLLLLYGVSKANEACFLGVTGVMFRDEEQRFVKRPAMVEVARGGFRVLERTSPVYRATPETLFINLPEDIFPEALVPHEPLLYQEEFPHLRRHYP